MKLSLNQNNIAPRAKQKWLIVALCDDDTNKIKFIERLEKAINIIQDNPTVNPKPSSISFLDDFTWISIPKIEPGINSGNDEHFHLSIYANVRHKIDIVQPYATALILDRDLLKRNGLEKYFPIIVKSNYFDPSGKDDQNIVLPTRKSNLNTPPKRQNSGINETSMRHKYAFCFGGTPNGNPFYRSYNDSLNICPNRDCRMCKEDTLLKCNHTCCWELVGTLLGAYQRPKELNPNPNMSVRRLIPKKFIYPDKIETHEK